MAAAIRRPTSSAASSPARWAISACCNLFKKYDLKTSFFIPGHSIETFPDQVKRIVDEGHEIGAHGYLHENPIAMTPTQEEAVLVKSHRPDREAVRQEAARLRRAVVGDVGIDRRAAAEIRLQIRPQPGLSRLPAVLCPRRRQLERDRLFQEGRGVDASAQARQGDRPRRDRRQLVRRRPAADDVHEEGAEQPRLRQSARHRGFVAATSSTGSIARWTMPCSPSPSIPTSAAGRRC